MFKIERWLAKTYNTNVDNIKNILKNEKATTYLIVWSTFEQKIFEGFMKKEKILNKAEKYSEFYDLLNVDEITRNFHLRYQDKKKFKNLSYRENNMVEIEEILSKQYNTLSNVEKLQLLFYVSYRYRNNIFHGNKGVLAWDKYTTQINDCILFMASLVDNCESKRVGVKK